MMHIKHSFIKDTYGDCFKNCENLKSFIKILNKISKAEFERTDSEQSAKKIKGDIFEIFCHFFVLERGSSNRVPIDKDSFEYCNANEDYGVDALGSNVNNKCCIQCKFRSNQMRSITYKEVAKTITQSLIKFKVQPTNNTIFFMTTANDYNDNVKNAVCLEFRPFLINFKTIDKETRNIDFWKRWYIFIKTNV